MRDAGTQAWLDQEDRDVSEKIRKHGVFLQYVLGDPDNRETQFCYTVGLFGIGHPELLVLGLSTHNASCVLNDLARQIREGRDLTPGELITFDNWSHRLFVEEVPNPGEIAFAANRHYEKPDLISVPVYQLTTDDVEGRFPWDDGYSIPDWVQPRPGDFRA